MIFLKKVKKNNTINIKKFLILIIYYLKKKTKKNYLTSNK